MTNLLRYLADPGTHWLLFLTIGCVYGFILFAWWWWHIGRTTEVYAYMTLLFLTAAIVLSGGLVARWIDMLEGHGETYHILINSKIWAARLIPLTIVIWLIVLRMTLRIWRTYQYAKGKKKNRRREMPHNDNGSIDL
jgi:hypothetical protein